MTPTQFYRKFKRMVEFKEKEWDVAKDGKIRRLKDGGYACPLSFMAGKITGMNFALAVYRSADALKLSHASAQRIAGAADNEGYPRVRAKLLAAIGR